MTCSKEKAILLHAMLDGEIDAVNAVRFEEHLATCALCRTEYERLTAIRGAIRKPGVSHVAPESLRRNIEAAIDRASAAAPAGSTRAPHRPTRSLRANWWISGVSLALAAGLALFIALPQQRGTPIEEQLVDSHIHSLLATHLTDVQSSDRHTVRPWFSGKVDVAPPAVDLADRGFPLVGGRLDYVDNRVVAAVVYRREAHIINVFVGSAPDAPDMAPRAETYRGYNLCHWRRAGTEFWAVTDASREELEAFAAAYSTASAAP